MNKVIERAGYFALGMLTMFLILMPLPLSAEHVAVGFVLALPMGISGAWAAVWVWERKFYQTYRQNVIRLRQ